MLCFQIGQSGVVQGDNNYFKRNTTDSFACFITLNVCVCGMGFIAKLIVVDPALISAVCDGT